MTIRLGIDVGGTFTDLIAIDADGRINIAKTLSTPTDPSKSIAEGLDALAATIDCDVSRLLEQTELVVHGSTVALNALLEHKGARTGLLCTEGFRDSLEIRLGAKERRYDWQYSPPPTLVPRTLRQPVRERVTKDGLIHQALVENDVRAAIEVFRQHDVEAIAVCFLWSFRNEDHERRVGEILAAELPETYVSLSVDVLPEIREYDRTSTTVINAYIGPVVQRYARDVESFLQSLGYRGAVCFMQSNAGLASASEIMRRPVYALGSGPAAGPAAGLFHARQHGRTDLLTVDMGGTSFDVCLVHNGEPDIVKGVDFHRYRLGIPMIDIHAVGAGGGSIARVDAGGLLQVGPISAGADPGPACYGRGGECATVTDADLILGYLEAERPLSGQIILHREPAERALHEQIATPLGLSLEQAALAVYAVVNNTMSRAIREVSIERGHDPRGFLLVVGGGCGPIHAWMLARELGLVEVLIPRVASNFCAFGEIVADLRHSYTRSTPCRISDADPAKLEALFAGMEEQGREVLAREGIAQKHIEIVRRFDLRYAGQMYECSVSMPMTTVTTDLLAEVIERFHDAHEALYAYAERDNPLCELITVGSVVSGHLRQPAITNAAANGVEEPTSPPTRPVFFETSGGFVETPVYQGASLPAGYSVAGPAIVEEVGTTVVVFDDAVLKVTPSAYRLIERASKEAA